MALNAFVGRRRELTALMDWAQEVATTSVGRFILVTGGPGVGKSRLCAQVSKQLGAGRRPVWARCWADGASPPLAPWPELLTTLARRRSMDWPDQPDGIDRASLFRSVVADLETLCPADGGVVFIDDLHAASLDAISLTKYVARSLHRVPLLLVATWRSEDVNGRQGRLPILARDADVITVGPFDEAEVADYVEHAEQTAPSPEELTALMSATGGHPMFVAELVGDPNAGQAERRAGLRDMLRRRLDSMSPRQRLVQTAAAVAGDGARVHEVAEMIREPVAEVTDLCAVAGTGASVVDQRVRFSHELVREAFEGALTSQQRLQLHLAASAAISGSDVEDVVRRSRHCVASAAMSSDQVPAAVAACSAASRALMETMAFEQAAEWAATGAAIAANESLGWSHAELLINEAEAVLACGRLAEARMLFGRAVVPAQRVGDWRLVALAALGLGGIWVEEQRDEVSRRRMLALCRRALNELGPDEPVVSGLLAVRLAAEQAYDGAPLEHVRDAVAAMTQLGDDAASAQALSLYHHTLLTPSGAQLRLQVAEELLDLAVSADSAIYSLLGLCWRTIDLYLLGDERAERSFVELRSHADVLGSHAVGYIVSVLDVMRAFRLGDLEEAERMAEEAVTLGIAAGDNDAMGYYGGHLLGIRWVQGRLDEMANMIETVMASATLRRRDRIYLAVKAYTEALRGDGAAARASIEAVLADGPQAVLDFSTGHAAIAILIEAARELDDGALALDLARHFAPYAHLPVMPSLAVICLGPGQRVMGVAHAAAGHADEAIAAFRQALTANRHLRSRPFDAIIRAELAEQLLQRNGPGDETEAAALYNDAIRRGEDLGLTARVSDWRAAAARRPAPLFDAPAMTGTIERRRDNWYIAVQHRVVTIEHLVGMQHIAELMARPDAEISAITLSAAVHGPSCPIGSSGTPALDDTARRAFQRRIAQLDRELDLADAAGEAERSRRAAAERHSLIDRLRRDGGLGGRTRRMSDDADRCRMRVSKAIRRALRRITAADAAVGRTLDARIRTGYACRYETDPAAPISWTVKLHPKGDSPDGQ